MTEQNISGQTIDKDIEEKIKSYTQNLFDNKSLYSYSINDFLEKLFPEEDKSTLLIQENWTKSIIRRYWSLHLDLLNSMVEDYFRNSVNAFFDDLDTIALKHNVSYSFGCGCCGGCSINVNGQNFNFIERI